MISGERQVYCAVCGEAVGVTQAAYRRVVFMGPEMRNYLSASLPDERFWTGASPSGTYFARGMYPERRRTSVLGDNSIGVVSGIPCYSGSASVSHGAVALPGGEYTFAVFVSHHELFLASAIQRVRITVTVNGSPVSREWTDVAGLRQLWVPFSVPSGGANVAVTLEVTTTSPWFFEAARIQEGSLPGGLVENVGSPVSVPRGKRVGVAVVCNRCVEVDPEFEEFAPNPDGPSVKDYPDIEAEEV